MHRFYLILLSILFGAIGLVTIGHAQSRTFDYQERPQRNFELLEAIIDLQLNPDEGSLSGSVEYQMKANINGADTLYLHAGDLKIDSVRTANGNADYNLKEGNLRVAVTDSSVMGDEYEVDIYYSGSPVFGLLKSAEGSMWTSLLPNSNRQWLPTVDHPGVSLNSTLSVTVPQQFTVAASGVMTDEETLGNGQKKSTFRTGRPIPVTALSFAVGRFNEEGLSFGIKRINSYAEPLTVSSERQNELVNEAERIIEEVEQATGLDYPYQRLHVVVLNDHHWEQKPYGASTVFLYKNRGDLEHQLRRGLYAQWFGVYQREMQWAQAWPINFFQTALHFNLSDEPATLKNTDSPDTDFTTIYDNFSVDNWNFWQQYKAWDRLNLKQIAERIIPEVSAKGPGTYTPQQYEDIWYRLSGQPAIDVPIFKPDLQGESGAQSDSVRYRVDYKLADTRQSLQLVFSAQQGVINEAVTLPVEIVSGGGANASSVRFSGNTDSTSISLPAGTQNIRLSVPDGRNLVLEQRKPVPFLLYQLRNAETTKARRAAAEQIGFHTDNPDLQLALNDFMDQSMEPEVEAALLRSYGDITAGATGTQKRFLEALDDESAAVREAALEVLQNYESEAVSQRLRAFAENEQDNELANQVLGRYMQSVDSSAAIQYTNTLVQQDTAGTKAITAIAALAEKGSTAKAVELAGFYIEPVYAYPVRMQALQILLANDSVAENWDDRLEMLLNDYDPRIRFFTIKNLGSVPGVDAQSVISSQIENEYDARVFRVLSRE